MHRTFFFFNALIKMYVPYFKKKGHPACFASIPQSFCVYLYPCPLLPFYLPLSVFFIVSETVFRA